MIEKKDHNNMGSADYGILQSLFHFSFADYYNPNNINFGVLRVINDDIVHPKQGFDLHPHKDMEIITYVIEGELTHKDSMNHKRTLTKGHVQYMSAGTGVYHSEHNLGENPLRFLQIWILPDKKNHTPQYGDYLFDWEARKNKWLHLVSGKQGSAPITIHQDVNLYAVELEKNNSLEFPIDKGRQAYAVLIDGLSSINGIELETRDGLEIIEESISIAAKETSHILLIEMNASNI